MAAAVSEQLSWADKPPFKRFFNFEVFEYRVRLVPHRFPHLLRRKHAVGRSDTSCDYRVAAWLQGKMVRIHAIWVGKDGPINGLSSSSENAMSCGSCGFVFGIQALATAWGEVGGSFNDQKRLGRQLSGSSMLHVKDYVISIIISSALWLRLTR